MANAGDIRQADRARVRLTCHDDTSVGWRDQGFVPRSGPAPNLLPQPSWMPRAVRDCCPALPRPG